MDPVLTWLLLGASAFVLVLVNLARVALKKHQGWQTLLFASLTCGVLAMLTALRMVDAWSRKRHWDYITDVVPTLTLLCSIAAALGIIMNLLALCLHMRMDKTWKEMKTDGKG